MEILNVVSLAGNGGVVLLTAMRWRRRRGNNWFVLSLAATDFLFSTLLMPELSEIHRGAGVSYNMCSFALCCMTAALIANACVLSLERCVASSHSSRNAARPTVMLICAPARIPLFLGATIMKLILLAKLASPDWKAPASPALDFTFPSIIACEVLIRCIVPFLFVYEWAPHTNASQEQLLLEASHEAPKRTDETQVQNQPNQELLPNTIQPEGPLLPHGGEIEPQVSRQQSERALFSWILLVEVCAISAYNFTMNALLIYSVKFAAEVFNETAVGFMLLRSVANSLAYLCYNTNMQKKIRKIFEFSSQAPDPLKKVIV